MRPEHTGNARGAAFMHAEELAVIDMMMSGMNGFEALQAIRMAQPATACVVLTGYGSIADAVKAMRLGGYNYLTKPCSIGLHSMALPVGQMLQKPRPLLSTRKQALRMPSPWPNHSKALRFIHFIRWPQSMKRTAASWFSRASRIIRTAGVRIC